MAESITGSVVGKIKFTIDKPSWDNLDKFQKKLTSVKKQMSNMHKTINVNAVVRATTAVANAQVKAVEKVAKAKKKVEGYGLEFGKSKGNNLDYVNWWKDALKAEDKALRDYSKRREQVLNNRAKANAARRKRKAGAVSAQSAYMDSVNAFMTVKESQVRNEAIRKGFYGTDKYAENMKALQKAYSDNVGLGNIKQFRANVNSVVNGMHTAQRAAEANRITFASMRGELVQLTAAYSAFTVVQNIAQTGMEMEGLRASAKVFAKDEAGVADHMKFIADEANRMGVNFQEAARSFTKFSLSTKGKLDKNTQRQLFSGVSEYAAVLQLDTPSYQRFFRAIQQMTDKGLYA